ncbi:MAG: malate synthase A [Acidimicrobiia bacterium]|nr:MAG: malate synthase A [Acidimicrobiia bacterium]
MLDSVEITGAASGRRAEILTPEALHFLASLEHRFGGRRTELLAMRQERQRRWDAGELPGFLPETESLRAADWKVSPPPHDLLDRRVEITGPVERKMMINALNSGARVFMADLEDANAPTWDNIIDGQVNLWDAVRRAISLTTDDGRHYSLAEETAILMVRPRGLHLVERHALVDGVPMAAGFFDLGLYLFHNAAELVRRGSGPYCYLPKMESHLEARLWDDLFLHAEAVLGLPVGTIRATVLIETVLAAFEMEEILHELREHCAGLNAGRWDYIFSIVKTFRNRPEMVLPDRGSITMTVPFMGAYTRQLVRACHRRGAHAIGGMAAFIPNRRNPEVTERALEQVAADKRREARDGFDGTWVAHPDLVATAMSEFDAVLDGRPNQAGRLRDDVTPDAAALLDVAVPGGLITETGLRQNVSVGIRYLASWLSGVGAAAIDDLMEDAATAEISRTQVWQWVRHGAVMDDGTVITDGLVRAIAAEEVSRIEAAEPPPRLDDALGLFLEVALADEFIPFLTIPAYDLI